MWTPKKYRGWSGVIHNPNYKKEYTTVTLIDPEGQEIKVYGNRGYGGYGGSMHSVSCPKLYIKREIRKHLRAVAKANKRNQRAENGEIVVEF